MFCSSCGKEISDTATFCHHCGNPVAKTTPSPQAAEAWQQPVAQQSPPIWAWASGGLLVVVLALAALLLFRQPETVEVTRLVPATQGAEAPVEVTRVVQEVVEVSGAPVEVTRVVVESQVMEVTRIVTETLLETVEVEVTRIVEVSNSAPSAPVTFAGGGDTLATVQNRGVLNCGISGALPGFSFVEADGSISGFDWDYCRAVAAAVLGNANAVQGRPSTAVERFPILQSGEIDVLIRNTTRTISRDSFLGFDFAPTTFYDGQGFMTRKESGITALKHLADRSICVNAGTTTEHNLMAYGRAGNMDFDLQTFVDSTSAREAYDKGVCDVYTTDKTGLLFTQSMLSDPEAHTILEATISKEPLGPLTRHGDDNWQDIVSWTVYCAIAAEEYSITSTNIDSFLGSDDMHIQNLLGVSGDLGTGLGLSKDFCYQVIKQVGSYAEIYNRNLGPDSSFNLPRGLNSLYSEGGLLYAPPFR